MAEKDRELKKSIEEIRTQIIDSNDFDTICSLKIQLSILIIKKEANDNRITGKWKNPKNLIHMY